MKLRPLGIMMRHWDFCLTTLILNFDIIKKYIGNLFNCIILIFWLIFPNCFLYDFFSPHRAKFVHRGTMSSLPYLVQLDISI